MTTLKKIVCVFAATGWCLLAYAAAFGEELDQIERYAVGVGLLCLVSYYVEDSWPKSKQATDA